MSHFICLVVTPDGDHDGALAPYHEFESTGVNDEYVQEVDETASARESYEKHGEDGQIFAAFTSDWYGYKPRPKPTTIRMANTSMAP